MQINGESNVNIPSNVPSNGSGGAGRSSLTNNNNNYGKECMVDSYASNSSSNTANKILKKFDLMIRNKF